MASGGYNTRRNQGGFAPSPNAVGQRRPGPVVTNNYITGQPSTGPNQQQQQNKPNVGPQGNQSQQQRVQPQGQGASNANIQFRNQQGQGQQQFQQHKPQTPQKPPQAQVQPQAQAQTPVQAQAHVQAQAQAQQLLDKMELVEGSEQDESSPKKKPVWFNKGVRIPKSERQRRRNIKLSRMLQPKNALMILNELVKNPGYTVKDVPDAPEQPYYEASVTVDEVEHKGSGRSKLAAKSSAAEAAIKHLIKYKRITEMKNEMDGGEAMEVTENDINKPLPWQHVASFALYKLFCSWGEDPNKARMELLQTEGFGGSQRIETRPAKKLPENAIEINPVMLLNQMQPTAKFEEMDKVGNTPNTVYTFKCTIGDEVFTGNGPSKKNAKKMAAFAACKKIYNIQYPPDVYSDAY